MTTHDRSTFARAVRLAAGAAICAPLALPLAAPLSARADEGPASSTTAPSWDDPRPSGGPTRIVGGEIADPAHWPGFAALRQTSTDGDVINYFCGGVAITSRWVLTAAHCLAEFADGPVANDVAMPGGARRRVKLQAALGTEDLNDLTPRDAPTRNLGAPAPAAEAVRPDSLLAAATPAQRFGQGGAQPARPETAAAAPSPRPEPVVQDDPAVFDIDRVVIHPDYRAALQAVPRRFGRRERQALEAMLPVVTGRDIALLRLARPWTGSTMPLSLDPAADPGPGAPVRVAGFGATERNSFQPPARLLTAEGVRPAIYAPSTLLREAGLPVMSLAACRTGYADIGGARIGANELCAGFEEGGRAACSGDSGGPLISLGDDGPTMIGLVSWGPTDPQSCGRPGRGVVYTRISRYTDWVRRVIEDDAATEAAAADVAAAQGGAGGEIAAGARPAPADVLRRIDLRAFVRQLGDLLGGEAQRNLQLTIDRGTRLPVGAETSFTLLSENGGYPVLLDIDADRRLNVILPTGSVRARDLPKTAAGVPFVIPLEIDRITSYEVAPPLGRGMLIGLVAPSHADVAALTVLDGMRTRDPSASQAPALALMRLLRSIEAAVATETAATSPRELGAEAGVGSGVELGAPPPDTGLAPDSAQAPETTVDDEPPGGDSVASAPNAARDQASDQASAETSDEIWGVAIVEYEVVAAE